MFVSVARPSVNASMTSSSSSSLPAPPSYSYSVASSPYEPGGQSVDPAPLPSYYAPNPHVRLDLASSLSSPSPSSSSSSSSLPISYSPSVPVTQLTSVAPSMRIYPAFHELYKPQHPTSPTLNNPPSSSSSAIPSPSSLSSYQEPLLSHASPSSSSSSPSHAAAISYPHVYLHSNLATASVPHTYSYNAPATSLYPPMSSPPLTSHAISPPTSALTPIASPLYSPLPSSQTVAAAPLNDAVHLASFQAQVAEERWLMSEAKEAERRQRQAEAERERSRLRTESSFAKSLASHVGSLFTNKRGSASSPSSGSSGRHRLTPGLSLDSKPPSQCASTPPPSTSAHRTKHLLTDQFAYNEQFPAQKFVRHLVVPTDDLVDLAVRYDTTPELIRRHNRRVVFQHLDNVMGEYIHIPVKEGFELPRVLEPVGGVAVEEEAKGGDDSYVVPGAGGLTNVELARQSEINRQFYAVRSFLSQVARRRSAGLGGPRAGLVPHIGDAGESLGDQECSEAEAEFYLAEANYNVHAALVAYHEDCEWEARELESKKQAGGGRGGSPLVGGRGGQGAGGRGGVRDAKSYSSLALALAQAKQARLSAIANDANSARRQQEWMERKVRKKYSMKQQAEKGAGARSMAAPLLMQQGGKAGGAVSDGQQADGGVGGVEERDEEAVPRAYDAPAFTYYQSLSSPAS